MPNSSLECGVRDGVYVLKLHGDVRLDLCSSIDRFVESVFRDGQLKQVLLDLTAATHIDSTTLGLLAKLSNGCRARLGDVPTLVCSNADILHFLSNMHCDDVFDVVDQNLCNDFDMAQLQLDPESEESTRARVIEAHQALVDLSDENRREFTELLKLLRS